MAMSLLQVSFRFFIRSAYKHYGFMPSNASLAPIILFFALLSSTIGATWESATQRSEATLWHPTQSDRQACDLGESVRIRPLIAVSYTAGLNSGQLSVFETESAKGRLVFAATLRKLDHPTSLQTEIECLSTLDRYSQYLKSAELVLGPAKRAVRIDVRNLMEEVKVALVIGEIDGEAKMLFSFRPLEVCPHDLAPCWNYSRKMTILPSETKAEFYDIRIDTRSWCTKKGNRSCSPAKGLQNYSEFWTFAGKEYERRH